MLFPEHVKLVGGVTRAEGISLRFEPSRPAVATSDSPDNVMSHYDLYNRLRAVLHSIHLITINDDTFLPLQTTEEFLDEILTILHTRVDGNRPPIAFFVQAWVHTFTTLTKAVRQDKTTVAAILSNPLQWRHFWVVQSITVGQSSQLSTHRQPSLETGTAAELKALQETARRLSGSPAQCASQEFLGDEYFDESSYSFRPSPYGGFKGGKGGGGRGKGKGKKGFWQVHPFLWLRLWERSRG